MPNGERRRDTHIHQEATLGDVVCPFLVVTKKKRHKEQLTTQIPSC